MAQKIDTGDVVLHEPSKEKWLVAYCKNGYVGACGWPETQAKEEDCTLIMKNTPQLRLALLHEMAQLQDIRGEYARDILSQPSEEA
jgi:hypothetical protein